RLPMLPTPGEAHAKLSKRLASRVAPPGKVPRKKETGAALAETQAWEAAGLHCSANERRADEASRDVEAWLKCKYMREHLGEEYGGVVSSVTSFGIFVTLDAMYVEGLVHITELGGEYFRFDEARQELRGERSGIRYVIGTRVQVQVSRVDLDGRRIDFRLVSDMPQEGAVRSKPGKPNRRSDEPETDAPAVRERRSPRNSAPAGRSPQAGKASKPGRATGSASKGAGKTAKPKGRAGKARRG
ncbi:MAG: S1 RNA-binding domain-containing protein, partial [Giesbergeria sp.]